MANTITIQNTASLEGQLLELATAAVAQENAMSEETNQNRFTAALDLDANEISISMTLPVVVTTTANGTQVAAVEYLP